MAVRMKLHSISNCEYDKSIFIRVLLEVSYFVVVWEALASSLLVVCGMQLWHVCLPSGMRCVLFNRWCLWARISIHVSNQLKLVQTSWDATTPSCTSTEDQVDKLRALRGISQAQPLTNCSCPDINTWPAHCLELFLTSIRLRIRSNWDYWSTRVAPRTICVNATVNWWFYSLLVYDWTEPEELDWTAQAISHFELHVNWDCNDVKNMKWIPYHRFTLFWRYITTWRSISGWR